METIVVTGANRGIGLGLTRRFLAAGWRVLATCREPDASRELQSGASTVIVCPVHPGWVRTEMGGPGADLSVAESVAGLFDLIEAMTMAHSGRFWTWKGEEHPW